MSYWGNKRVTVTGGAGFLGSFVVEKLRERGCESIFIPRSKEYNLVDMNAVTRLYQDSKPDMVIHLAARVGGIGANQANPGKYFYENLMMGCQLMEVGRQVGLEKMVAVGTICSYPKMCPTPFQEEHIWDGYPEETNAPYGLAKKMLLVQSQAYREQYGFNSVVLFPVNLYGPRDNFDPESSHVIPALIRKCLESQSHHSSDITVWGTGNPTREFLYVEDAAEGILLAAEYFNTSEPVNLGSGHDISILELVSLVVKITGFSGQVLWDASKPDGQPRRLLRVQKAKDLFGFTAAMPLLEGLSRTIDWYRSNHKVL